MRNLFWIIILGFIYGSVGTSCVSHKDLLNFNEGPAWDSLSNELPPQPALLIQVDDILQVAVWSIEPTVAVPFNPVTISDSETQAGAGAQYLVDKEGNIDFPVLGKIKVAGKTPTEVKEDLMIKLKAYIKEPIVSVRFLNFKFTILGEVNSPGTYTILGNRISLLEALGKCGDLTLYSNRTNILIIREREGKREYAHINLQDKDFLNSPYFFLYQNDVIYVESTKYKTALVSDRVRQILPWMSVVVTATNLIINLTTR